jgi:predicted small lipoprotein YifL
LACLVIPLASCGLKGPLYQPDAKRDGVVQQAEGQQTASGETARSAQKKERNGAAGGDTAAPPAQP